MRPGQIDNLLHLAGGNIARVDPADTATLSVYFKHDTHGAFMIHPENILQNVNDEIHGGEIVIQQEHLIERWWTQIHRFSFENSGAFLGFSMVSHGHNLRLEGQIFNGFGIKVRRIRQIGTCGAA